MVATLGTNLNRFALSMAFAVGVSLVGCATPAPKKSMPQYAVPRTLNSQPKEEPKSGIGSWFKSESKEKPPNVPSWMDSTKRMDP